MVPTEILDDVLSTPSSPDRSDAGDSESEAMSTNSLEEGIGGENDSIGNGINLWEGESSADESAVLQLDEASIPMDGPAKVVATSSGSIQTMRPHWKKKVVPMFHLDKDQEGLVGEEITQYTLMAAENKRLLV